MPTPNHFNPFLPISTLWARLLLLLVTQVTFSYSNEYPYRDISKPIIPLPENVRIIQYSPPRTGSTLVFNILQYLFEDTLEYHYQNQNKKVIKTHDPEFCYEIANSNFETYVVSTIRNPLNSLASSLFISEEIDEDGKVIISKENLDVYINRRKDMHYKLYKLLKEKPTHQTLCLKYEYFIDDFEYIFSKIEDLFCITIDENSKEFITQTFNINAIKSISSEYDTFKHHHSYLGIHGKHVNHVEWKKNIPEKFHEYLLTEFHEILQLFGYFNED